jgi:hypothetical protein
VGAGGQDNLVGTDVPNTLAGNAGGGRAGEVVGAVLDRDHVVGVVRTERRGPVQHGAFCAGDELGLNVGNPFQCGLALDGFRQCGGGGSGQQGPAEFGLVVHQDDAGAAADGFACRGQAGGAATDHEDVGVDVLLVVLGAVIGRVQLAQAVQEAGLQAVHQGHGGGGEHGFGNVAGEAGFDPDQGVGLFHAGGEDAAGTVLVQRVAGGDAAVGQQRGGQGVARVSGEFLAVHGEAPGDAAVDAAAGAEARVLGGHLVAPSGAVLGLRGVVLAAPVLAVPVSAAGGKGAAGRGTPIG